MYDILWNLHYFCETNHTKSILTDLFPNYTEEKQSIRKFFRSYVYPAMFNMVVMALYNIVDRIFIGQGAGALAICGLALTLPCVSLLSTVGTLTGVGAAARISTSISLGNRSLACCILGNATVLNILLSTILIVYSLYHLDFILDIFGGSGQTIPYARKYMSILIPASLLTNLNFTYCHAIRASGFSRKSMTIVFAGVIANIILDPIFIFGFHMGVRGAALATILSQALSCIWVLCFLFGKKTVLKLKKNNMRIKKEIILPCLALGLSVFIMQASESVISVCFNSSLLKYGGDIAVGAMTILTSVMQFAMLPLQGLGQGAQPIISYNYGAGNRGRVKKAFILLLKCSMFYAILFWAIVMLFPQMFVGMFTSDAALAEFTQGALRIYMAVVCLFGIQMACQITFGALGNAKSSILVAVMRKFILLIPLIYIMPMVLSGDKTMAVYMAEPVADVLAITFTGVLFFFQFRKVMTEMKQREKR